MRGAVVIWCLAFLLWALASPEARAQGQSCPLGLPAEIPATLPLQPGARIELLARTAQGSFAANEPVAVLLSATATGGGSPRMPVGQMTVESSGATARLLFAPDIGAFPRPAETTLRWRITAGGQDCDVAMRLTRAPAALDARSTERRVLTLWRPVPLGTAEGTVTLRLAEGNAHEVEGLRLIARDLRLGEAREVVPGAAARPPDAALTIPGGGSTEAAVSLSGLSHVGTYETTLRATAPAFAQAVEIQLAVTVSDGPVVPALVILLGVALGAWVSWLNTRAAPQVEQELKVAALREQLRAQAPWRDAPAALRGAHRTATDALRSAERALLDGTSNETAITGAQTAAQALGTAWAAARGELDASLAAERDATRQLKRFGIAETDMAALLAGLAEASGALEGDADLGAAAAALGRAAAQRTVAARSLSRTKPIRQALSDLGDLGNPGRPMLDRLQTALREAEDPAAGPDKIMALASLLDEAARTVRQHALLAGGEVRLGTRGPAGGPTELGIARIEVITPPADRLAGRAIELRASGMAPDAFAWEAEDGAPRIDRSEPERLRLTYAQPGSFRVRLVLMDGTPAAEHGVTVLSPAEVSGAASARRRRQQVELALTAASLVIAMLTGLLALYVDKPFGSLRDYITAFLWGVGVDLSLRGFAAVRDGLQAANPRRS